LKWFNIKIRKEEKMTRKEITSLIILALVLLIGVYKFVTAEYEHIDSKYLNYTPNLQGKNLKTEIYVVSDKKNVEAVTQEAFDYMQQLIYKYSEDCEDSQVYKINHSAGKKYPMDDGVYVMLEKAREMYELTEGCFDISVKPVFDLWDFDSAERGNYDHNKLLIPDTTEVQAKLRLVDFSQIEYTQDYIILPENMKLTFGAISKGYIVDKTVEFLQERGVKAGYVDQTSSIRYFGELTQQIKLGIQHPRDNSRIIAELTNLNNMAIATSGDYQQFFDIETKRYHHLIDAKTGYPCNRNVSVTILSTSAFDADALSTALFLMDSDKAIDYLKGLKETEAIIYTDSYDEIGQTWEAISIKTQKTEYSKGMEYYLYNEFIDGE